AWFAAVRPGGVEALGDVLQGGEGDALGGGAVGGAGDAEGLALAGGAGAGQADDADRALANALDEPAGDVGIEDAGHEDDVGAGVEVGTAAFDAERREASPTHASSTSWTPWCRSTCPGSCAAPRHPAEHGGDLSAQRPRP